MAGVDKLDLNNTGPGTSYTHDFHDSRNHTGTRTHWLGSGVDTPTNVATKAASAVATDFPSTTIPIQSRTVRKFDNGRAIAVERYRRRRSQGGSTSAATALLQVSGSTISVPWYSKVEDTSAINNTFDPYEEDDAGVRYWMREFEVFVISIPTILESTPYTGSVLGMVNKTNSNIYNMAGTTFAAYTLLFRPPSLNIVVVGESPVTYQWVTQYVYVYRPDGFYREGHRRDMAGNSVIERRLTKQPASFVDPPYGS